MPFDEKVHEMWKVFRLTIVYETFSGRENFSKNVYEVQYFILLKFGVVLPDSGIDNSSLAINPQYLL